MTFDRRRAQSTVLAVVLLVGVVGTMSIGLVLMANASIENTQQAAEDDRIEQAFLSLDGHVDAVARSDNGTTRSVDLELSGNEGAVRKEGTGRIVVNTSNRSSPVIDQPLGAIEYESGETTLAYQAGAVWRNSGNDTTMVSRPDLDYRGRNTLTLPITSFEGDEHLSGGEVTIRKNRTVSPLSEVTFVEGETVTINITSQYYVGWEQYFRENVNDVAIQSVDHDENRVIVQLGQRELDGNFETGVVAAGDVDTGNGGGPNAPLQSEVITTGTFSGDISCSSGSGDDCVTEGASVDMMALDGAIQQRLRTASGNASIETTIPSTGATLDAGTYYVDDDIYLDGSELELDLEDGNVTLLVNGSLALENGNIRVTNGDASDSYARVYTNGDMAMSNGNAAVTVEDDNPGRFQMYGTSEFQFAMGQSNNPGFQGVIYAPRDDPASGQNDAVDEYGLSSASCDDPTKDICIGSGSGTVSGSIIGGPMELHQSTTFEYDSQVRNIEPRLPDTGVVPPPITYLHASVHEVDIESAD
ncbi:hypothetical protein G9464_14860 [Halostella sp. JP-L12]|uniref:DUF7289 family protein n=1 Tax=Halostella TaxID=1843185 RepID=UPI000EF7D49E|nr:MULTISPECIES: hypothetical protein [Halostella]NHN48867.1 hypothetical protein [Halostella sp. JP-L12]